MSHNVAAVYPGREASLSGPVSRYLPSGVQARTLLKGNARRNSNVFAPVSAFQTVTWRKKPLNVASCLPSALHAMADTGASCENWRMIRTSPETPGHLRVADASLALV